MADALIMPDWALSAACGAIVVLVIAVLVLTRALAVLRGRHNALAHETGLILRLHQDYAANIDGRLRALGSRTTGDEPIPTSAEMLEGRWQR